MHSSIASVVRNDKKATRRMEYNYYSIPSRYKNLKRKSYTSRFPPLHQPRYLPPCPPSLFLLQSVAPPHPNTRTLPQLTASQNQLPSGSPFDIRRWNHPVFVPIMYPELLFLQKQYIFSSSGSMVFVSTKAFMGEESSTTLPRECEWELLSAGGNAVEYPADSESAHARHVWY